MVSPWKNRLDVICAKGEKKKKLPSFSPCPCHPSGKRSGSPSLSLSLFLSPLSISPSDERRTMITSTTKGPAACVWMRLFFLLSFLLLLYLFLLNPSDLTYSLLPLCPLHYPPLHSLPSCSISCCLTPLSSFAPPFFVRASAIQSGYGIKNQKVSLSKRHPGWCTLMSPLKFEIHMLSHLILFPLSPSLTLSLSFFFFFHLPPLLSVKCHHVLFSDEERNERNGEMYKAL